MVNVDLQNEFLNSRNRSAKWFGHWADSFLQAGDLSHLALGVNGLEALSATATTHGKFLRGVGVPARLFECLTSRGSDGRHARLLLNNMTD